MVDETESIRRVKQFDAKEKVTYLVILFLLVGEVEEDNECHKDEHRRKDNEEEVRRLNACTHHFVGVIGAYTSSIAIRFSVATLAIECLAIVRRNHDTDGRLTDWFPIDHDFQDLRLHVRT